MPLTGSASVDGFFRANFAKFATAASITWLKYWIALFAIEVDIYSFKLSPTEMRISIIPATDE